ncbi:hypothetical protein [Reichenbachiella ulvae]|uniref:Lipocalin-like domain-containing protein n=1 Tax=Reichenbachiella ulvae TaxID=2980104 RepID=A0ABT3CX82_9BACT|nr:hypothetical protein [Reichenbachiella ulvae]MCV9388186.1 hypothetical protein [Reichenbachiella ulvae]
MKMLLSLSIVLVFLASCQQQEVIHEENIDNPLVGKWKLIEQLADPGDGSGTFRATDKNLQIEFFENKTFKATRSMCSLANYEPQTTEGKVDLNLEVLYPEGCDNLYDDVEFQIQYKMEDGQLLLYYFCIEGCGQKFEKLN